MPPGSLARPRDFHGWQHPGSGTVRWPVAGGRGEEGFALAQGDEQPVGEGGLVPEHAFAPAEFRLERTLPA